MCHLSWCLCDLNPISPVNVSTVSWQRARRKKGCSQRWNGPSQDHPSYAQLQMGGVARAVTFFACASAANAFSLCSCQRVNVCAPAGRTPQCTEAGGLMLYGRLSGQWRGSTSTSSSLTADILQSAAGWTGRNKQGTSPGMLMRHGL